MATEMELETVVSRLRALLKTYFFISSSTTVQTKSSRTLPTMKTLDEADVGIFCFISKLPGFRGILKQRYSDFIVNEVDTDGNVIHLKTLDVPPEMVVKLEEETKPASNDKSYTSEVESFRLLAGDSNAERLQAFIEQIISSGVNDLSPIVLDPSSDKSHRTAVHTFFKENFKFLVTDTVDGPDSSSKCIRVRLNSGGNNNRGRNPRKRKERADKTFDSRGSESWPQHVGKFLRFHLYKENKDTQEALGLIAKMLGIQPKSFGFSGTKDKRSVSTQQVTVFKQYASKLAALNERLIAIKVGDFCHVKEGLALGQLSGNRFTITLRGVVADSEETIKASTESLGRHGFINYFGLQRFGSGSVPTHHVGAALLRGEWKGAVSLILNPREGAQKNVIAKAREFYQETGDVDGTLKQLPRHLVAERAILQCLKKCPGNYLQALKGIPRTLRMMYVHSYQSYLWNHAASIRVQKYGTNEVVLGDLVYLNQDDGKNGVGGLIPHGEDDNGELDEVDASRSDDATVVDHPGERNDLVKVVTAEDIQAGTYSIDDIVLPLPGSSVIYPSNDIAEVYSDLSKKDGINLTEGAHGVKEFSITSMSGAYRRVFQKPINFQWDLLKYSDPHLPLAETDYEMIIKNRPIDTRKDESNNDVGGKAVDCDYREAGLMNGVVGEATDPDAKQSADCSENDTLAEVTCIPTAPENQVALKIAFTLPASCYATMAIRELLKTSTSVAFHKTLNQ